MEFSENIPIYMQIVNHFCSQILEKKWKAGERIPSVREIAVSMEVNPNTAIRAFHFLQNEKILYNERGVGYFVSDAAPEKVKALKRQELIKQKLPVLFRDMELLEFSFSELRDFYNTHQGKKS